MALIDCPECGRRVSDRAKACPDCGFPVAEEVAAARAEEERAAITKTREIRESQVDCVHCKARGFIMHGDSAFTWCHICEHSGRVALGAAADGYYAVAPFAVDAFLSGEANPDDGTHRVVHIGTQVPSGHRYSKAGRRISDEEWAAMEAQMGFPTVPKRVSVEPEPPTPPGKGAAEGEGEDPA